PPPHTAIHTLSLHDALPIFIAANLIHSNHLRRHGADQHHHSLRLWAAVQHIRADPHVVLRHSLMAPSDLRTLVHNPHTMSRPFLDRKSTRLNSSHVSISYAV